MGAIVRQPALAAALPLLVLLAISLPQPATSPRDAPTGASSQWPRCDECEAVATAIGATLDRQRKPKRKGGGLRELSESVLGELFEDEICIPERYKGYALASEREHMGEVQRLQGPGISWSEGLAPPPPDALLAQLGRRINQRLATRCQDVADGVGLTEIYGMFRYVAERGEEHQAQLCPPGSGGGPIGTTHCDADGSYSAKRGFAHALCKSELGDCDDEQRPDPVIDDPASASAISGKKVKDRHNGGDSRSREL